MLTIVNTLGLSFFILPRRARMEVDSVFRLRIVTDSETAPYYARMKVDSIFRLRIVTDCDIVTCRARMKVELIFG